MNSATSTSAVNQNTPTPQENRRLPWDGFDEEAYWISVAIARHSGLEHIYTSDGTPAMKTPEVKAALKQLGTQVADELISLEQAVEQARQIAATIIIEARHRRLGGEPQFED